MLLLRKIYIHTYMYMLKWSNVTFSVRHDSQCATFETAHTEYILCMPACLPPLIPPTSRSCFLLCSSLFSFFLLLLPSSRLFNTPFIYSYNVQRVFIHVVYVYKFSINNLIQSRFLQLCLANREHFYL